MGTISQQFTAYVTATSSISDKFTVTVTQPSRITLSAPSHNWGGTLPVVIALPNHKTSRSAKAVDIYFKRYGTSTSYVAYGGSSSTQYTGSVSTSVPISSFLINTADFFNTSNPTSRTASIPILWFSPNNYKGSGSDAMWGEWQGFKTSGGDESSWFFKRSATTSYTMASLPVYLDAPPTFDTTQVSINNATSIASVTVSNMSAQYGGTIASAVLTIGNATSTPISSDGVLSVELSERGIFTPTVTVTDSRGQTTTTALDPITVLTPSVQVSAERTLSTGIPDDDGSYAVITTTYVFSDDVTKLEEPTVTVTEEGGTTTTATPTWYSSRANDGELSGSVTWGNITSGETVYGLISGFDPNLAYQISVTPIDSIGDGTPTTQTLAPAFFTIDVLAGGHGIAFGQPASEEGFFCNMDANFMQDVYLALDTTATSGTDKELYDALVSLGWTDVIV